MKSVTSTKNPIVKSIADLRESKHRRNSGLILVEGAREIERALAAGVAIDNLLVCQDRLSGDAEKLTNKATLDVSQSVYEHLAMRDNVDGVILVGRAPPAKSLDTILTKTKRPLIIALEAIEKPGNLGAVVRSADGAGVTAVIALNGNDKNAVDIWHPQAIRASIGAIFAVPVLNVSNEDFAEVCAKHNLQVVCTTQSKRSKPYTTIDFSKPSTIVLGEEARGLSAFWLEQDNALHAEIPMRGIGDSLNLSVAAALMMYQAKM